MRTTRHVCPRRGTLIFTTNQFTLMAYRATTLLLLKVPTSMSPILSAPLQLGGSALSALTVCLSWDPGQYLCLQQTISLQHSSVFPRRCPPGGTGSWQAYKQVTADHKGDLCLSGLHWLLNRPSSLVFCPRGLHTKCHASINRVSSLYYTRTQKRKSDPSAAKADAAHTLHAP